MLAIQEPFLDKNNLSRPPSRWTSIYPSTHHVKSAPRSRSFLAISPALSSNGWEQVPCNCPDVTAVRVRTAKAPILVINVYNPCDSNAPLPLVDKLIESKLPGELIVLIGDFNRHHPLWDEERNSHLFTKANLDLAQELLDLTATHDLEMALPKDLPTLESHSSGNFTRPDNVFLSFALSEDLILCTTEPELRVDMADHFPIRTEIDVRPARVQTAEKWNFKQMDSDALRVALAEELQTLQQDSSLDSQEELDTEVAALRECIENAIKVSVPRLRLCKQTKRWWTGELTAFRRRVRKLATKSYRVRMYPDHPAHKQFRVERANFSQAMRDAKQRHWLEYLEGLDNDSLWTAGNYVGGEATDGGRARIPNLRTKDSDGTERVARENPAKSKVLMDSFFPQPAPPSDARPPKANPPVEDLLELSVQDVREAILGFKPHKAPGPDGIPACVYREAVDLLAGPLHRIYSASLRTGNYPAEWRHSRTVVLRKPGKPDYTVAKAYRPIALLNVVGKILSACVAKRLNTLAEMHGWLPAHHFGGRPGRTTTDALHLLVKKVKDAWSRNEVASALFLDVKGAFPHANPYQLAENMRRLGVPRSYRNWALTKLEGHTTCLAFDDFVSDPLPILNGIDQGCPLSVIFYLIYNSPLVRVAQAKKDELCVAYIDDITQEKIEVVMRSHKFS
ncbi:Reverse transcriptase from transposon X-element protein [Ceratobasidium sp. AG-Ba]|nr:Reverse transcriptase from transposon X-element protein [Ceratobasidium sp. AG-Ba]QRV91733.1 Reverse transcriptase from transposon X-element protein [Ceratobasidium sp. AG-Ba]